MGGIIPRNNESITMQPRNPVPVRGASSVGNDFQGLADLGQSIQRMGSTIIDHVQKQDEMAQRNKLEIASSAIEKVHSEGLDYAQRNSQPDGSNINDVFNQYTKPRIDEIQKNLGPDKESPYADKLSAFTEAATNHAGARLFLTKAAMLETYNQNGAMTVGDTMADSVRENPTPEMLAARVKGLDNYLGDLTGKGIFKPEQAMKLKNGQMEKFGLQMVSGLYERGQYGAALNFLKANQQDDTAVSKMDPRVAVTSGLIDQKEADQLLAQGKTYDQPVLTRKDLVQMTPEMTQAMMAIDPAKKAALIDHMKNKAEAETQLKLSELNSQVSSFEQIAYSGGNYTEAQKGTIKSQINGNSSLHLWARKRLMDAVDTADVANGLMKAMQSAPRSQWQSIAGQFDDRIKMSEGTAAKFDPNMTNLSADMTIRANRMKAKNTLDSEMDQLAKFQSKDAASFAIQSDNQLTNFWGATKDGDPNFSQRYAREAIARQTYLEIPPKDQRVLPKNYAEQIGSQLKGIPDSETTNDFLSKLQNQWGPAYPRVLKEISGSDKSLANFSIATYAQNDTRADLVDSIKNSDAITKQFKTLPDHEVIGKLVVDRAETITRPLSQAILGSANETGNMNILNNFQTAITTQARRDIVQKGMEPTAAVEKAYSDIVDKQYHIVPTGKSMLLVPKDLNGVITDADKISQSIRQSSYVEGLKNLNLMIPNDPLGKYKRDPNTFYEDLAQTGKWVTNQQQDGARLMTVEMDGHLSPVYDKYGKSVELKYKDIMTAPLAKQNPTTTKARGSNLAN